MVGDPLGPDPIIIDLSNQSGFELRQKAAEFVKSNKATGPQRGSIDEQTYGILAEMTVRTELGIPELDPKVRPFGYDILSPTGVKIDVKCRGGEQPFRKMYEGRGGMSRESKHNLYARQVYDDALDTDIYVMTHLRHPTNGVLPGSGRQRSWQLYVCGWISKKRALKEGVYLPPGALSERGSSWFPYRAHEIEVYHKNLNSLSEISNLLKITSEDVEKDANSDMHLNMTSVDAGRIALDLVNRGVLPSSKIEEILGMIGLGTKTIPTIYHPNQYFHLLRWLAEKGIIIDVNDAIASLEKSMKLVQFEGLGS